MNVLDVVNVHIMIGVTKCSSIINISEKKPVPSSTSYAQSTRNITVNRMESDDMRTELTLNERFIDTLAGGEIAETVKQLVGEKFKCTCGHVIEINEDNFICYAHDGGLEDKSGQKWWLYIGCSKCGYDWSWRKVERKVRYND